MQKINVSAGAAELTVPLTITETTGKDISAAPIKMSLGTETLPGDWVDPDVDSSPGLPQRTLQLLVSSALDLDPGTYWVWTKLTDPPEVVPRKHFAVEVV